MGFSLQPASIKLKMGFRKTHLIAKTSYKNEAFLKNKKMDLANALLVFRGKIKWDFGKMGF